MEVCKIERLGGSLWFLATELLLLRELLATNVSDQTTFLDLVLLRAFVRDCLPERRIPCRARNDRFDPGLSTGGLTKPGPLNFLYGMHT